MKDSFVSRLLETASCDTEEAEVHEVCNAVPAATYIGMHGHAFKLSSIPISDVH